MARAATCNGSAEIAGFQGRVGLVDDLELLLEDLVAAVGVRVVLLDQHLIARLETQRSKGRIEIEYHERLIARGGGACRRAGMASIGAVGAVVVLAMIGAAVGAVVKPERVADARAIGRRVKLAEP